MLDCNFILPSFSVLWSSPCFYTPPFICSFSILSQHYLSFTHILLCPSSPYSCLLAIFLFSFSFCPSFYFDLFTSLHTALRFSLLPCLISVCVHLPFIISHFLSLIFLHLTVSISFFFFLSFQFNFLLLYASASLSPHMFSFLLYISPSSLSTSLSLFLSQSGDMLFHLSPLHLSSSVPSVELYYIQCSA